MAPTIPANFKIGNAQGGADSFFDCVAQGLNQLRLKRNHNVRLLRNKCEQHAKELLNREKSWLLGVINGEKQGMKGHVGDVKYNVDDNEQFQLNLHHCIWGRPEIEGRILSDIFKIRIHILRKEVEQNIDAYVSKVIVNDSLNSLKSEDVDYDADDTVHLLLEGDLHFKPILKISEEINPFNPSCTDDPSSESSDETDAKRTLNYRLISVIRSKRSEGYKVKKIEELLNKGADVDFRDANDKRNTVLHVAIRKNELKVVGFLVKNNANIHIRNNDNISSWEYANKIQNSKILDILTGKLDDHPAEDHGTLLQGLGGFVEMKSVSLKSNLDVLPSRPKFRKLSDDSGASGHRFEINLLTLFKILGENLTNGFYLAGNLEEAGAFDDVVFRYWNADGKWRIIFLQAKHKQNARHNTINFETLATHRDFNLKKYFASYLEIKEKFKGDHTAPIFRGEFDKGNCEFVIVTNACLDEGWTRGLIRLENEAGGCFKIGKGGNVIKVELKSGVECLKESEMKEYVGMISKKFIEFVSTDNNDDLMARDELVKEYHVFWATFVLNVDKVLYSEPIKKQRSRIKDRKFRKAKFFQDFLQGLPDSDLLLKRFRQEVLREVEKRQLGQKIFKVPEGFGNIGETLCFSNQTDRLCKLITDLITQTKIGNKCLISKVNDKKLAKDLFKLVGNVLVLNEASGFLKIYNGKLEGETKKVRDTLMSAMELEGYDHQVEFDFQMKGFPKLSLRYLSTNQESIEDFVNSLTIYTDQPSAVELDGIIKEELKEFYKLTDEETHRFFLRINDRMTKWWQTTGSVRFLRKGDEMLSSLVRFGIHHRLKVNVQSFTGRIQELKWLHEALLKGNAEGKYATMMTVSGLGGIGKSELARKYAAEYGNLYDDNVIWIDAENLSTMRYSFRTLCQNVLNITTKDDDGRERDLERIVRDVYSFFGKRKSLFIFDNAQSYKDEGDSENGIKPFLPKPSSTDDHRPRVIVTSRNSCWPNEGLLRLDTFSDEEAHQFIKSFLKIEDDEQNDSIKTLISTLQNFPLALQQSVAFIREQNADCKIFDPNGEFKIADYLNLFEQKNRDLLSFKFPEDSLDYYTTSTFKTWNVTIETIQKLRYGKKAREILELMAYLEPNYIPIELFSSVVENEKRLRLSVRLLLQYSLVTEDEEGQLSVHRLVQQVVRLNLKDEKKERTKLHQALTVINNHDQKKRKLIVQGLSVWKYVAGYRDLIEEFNILPCKILTSLIQEIRYEDASSFGYESLKQLRPLGQNHQSVISVQNHVSELLYKQGKYDRALASYNEVLGIQTQILGPDHPTVLDTRHNVALVLSKRGRLDEASKIYSEVVEKQRTVVGPNHPSTLTTQHNIAMILLTQERYDDALAAFNEVHAKQILHLDRDDPLTLTTRNNIAMVLSKQGKYDDALKTYWEIAEKQCKILGPDHPSTLTTQHNIAAVLSKQDKRDEALNMYVVMFKTKLKLLGPENPSTLNTQLNIADVLAMQGKYDEALTNCFDILEKQTETLGADNSSTLTTQYFIANILQEQGKYEEALKLHSEVYERRTTTLGPNDLSTITSQNMIAMILFERGKYDDALVHFLEILKKKEIVLGPKNSSTLATRQNIARIYTYQGDYDEALKLYLDVFQKEADILGLNNPLVLTAQDNVARILSDLGKSEL